MSKADTILEPKLVCLNIEVGFLEDTLSGELLFFYAFIVLIHCLLNYIKELCNIRMRVL